MSAFLLSGTGWSLVFWFLFFIVGIYTLTYYLVYIRQTKRWEQSNIPFLEPTFLIGHKYLLKTSEYSLSVPIEQIYKENREKDLVGFFLGPLPVILVKNPRMIQQVFSQNFGLPQMNVFAEILREGGEVMSPEEQLRFSRSGMSPLFSPNWYQGRKFEFLKAEINELRQTAEKAELGGSPIDVEEVTVKTLKNIFGAYFGIDKDSHEMKSRLWSIVDAFFEPTHRRSILLFALYIFPFLQVIDFFKMWSRKSCNNMSEIIKHNINLRDQNYTEPRDFIDILQSIRRKEESKKIYTQDPDVSSISKGILAKLTMVGMAAVTLGSDGVQKLLALTIHSLSLHPECQSKIRSEVDKALREHGVSELNYDVVRSLTYLNHCIKETARLYPPSSILTKVCREDFEIPGTKYILRKGDTLVLPFYSGNRDEMNFKDPHSFQPERFDLNDTDKSVPEILLSFGLGLTKCPGYPHGLFIIAALIASVLQKYEIKPRSHLKLMDATDFLPQGIVIQPRRKLLVDLVPSKNLKEA